MDELWHVLLDLEERTTVPWTLVGGQMVLLHALERTGRVGVRLGDRAGVLPRPSLLGALVGKGAASGLPGDPARHLRDLALLCSLVDDPFDLRGQMRPKDVRRLRTAWPLHDPRHVAWSLLDPAHSRVGQATYSVLTGEAL